jgi:hypothetical protein
MKDRYTMIFCSRNSNAIVNSGIAQSVTYLVNWSSILDSKYKRFHCQFIFKSENNASVITQNGFVNMNFANFKIFDGQSMSQNIGVIYPVAFNGTNTFLNSTNNDNNDFLIRFPNNNNVTININTFTGTAMTTVPHYALIMTLEGIED